MLGRGWKGICHLIVEQRHGLEVQQRVDGLAGGLVVQLVHLLPNVRRSLRRVRELVKVAVVTESQRVLYSEPQQAHCWLSAALEL